jgi:hypothetical protein
MLSELCASFLCSGLRGGGRCAVGAGAELPGGARGAGGRDVLRRGAGRGPDRGPVPRLQPQHQLREGLRRPVGLPRRHSRLIDDVPIDFLFSPRVLRLPIDRIRRFLSV